MHDTYSDSLPHVPNFRRHILTCTQILEGIKFAKVRNNSAIRISWRHFALFRLRLLWTISQRYSDMQQCALLLYFGRFFGHVPACYYRCYSSLHHYHQVRKKALCLRGDRQRFEVEILSGAGGGLSGRLPACLPACLPAWKFNLNFSLIIALQVCFGCRYCRPPLLTALSVVTAAAQAVVVVVPPVVSSHSSRFSRP